MTENRFLIVPNVVLVGDAIQDHGWPIEGVESIEQAKAKASQIGAVAFHMYLQGDSCCEEGGVMYPFANVTGVIGRAAPRNCISCITES